MSSIVPQDPFPPAAIRELLELLDTGAAVDAAQATRWRYAIEDGQWTPAEAMAAARWLNLNHTGYIKIAHVHEHITAQRQWLKGARVLCYRSDAAIDVMHETGRYEGLDQEQVVRIYQDDPRGWRAEFEDAVMQRWDTRTWVEWIKDNSARFGGAA